MLSKTRTICLALLLLSASLPNIAQLATQPKLFLKSRILLLPEGIPRELVRWPGSQRRSVEAMSLVIIQFDQIPDNEKQEQLRQHGVELLEYVPDHAYTATITGSPDTQVLENAGVRAVFSPGAEDIVEPALLSGVIPDHARPEPGKADLRLSFVRSFTLESVLTDLSQSGFELLSKDLEAYHILDVRIPEGNVRQLAGFPWAQYISPVPAPAEMLNDKSTASTRANVLGSTALLGYKLTGEGVVIGLGDDSNPIVHPDIGQRVIDYNPLGTDWHGVHVGGTAAGSGLLNEKYRGYAPGANLVVKSRSRIVEGAAQLVRDFGMVVTSNTYAGRGGCLGFGAYSDNSYVVDKQAYDLPHLEHIFAAGNSGLQSNCFVSPVGFGTVLGDWQSAKNVLTVGNTQTTGIISPGSSKGPTKDGRIKPEVAAPGSNIVSSIPGNKYQNASGTSMAAPAVTGGAALLYQRYRQLHQQHNPDNALIKALICNGATDIGLPGPDYAYGFGQMNLLRSVTMLDKGHYISGELAHQAANTHNIVVPANTARLKVLIYWNDPAPALLAEGKTLVNDLDLSVTMPGNGKVLPKFPMLANPAAVAVSGIDTVNNIEQIVLDEPAPGTYSLRVEATRIPQGVQEYFIVYDIQEAGLTVTYPLAGEHLTKGDAVNIHWDSYGDPLKTFHVSYSLNDGASWTTLNAAVAADQRQLAWTVPDGATGKAKIRVMKNGTDVTSIGGPFTILGVPSATLQAVQCEGYIALQWNAVSGASDYEVMISTGNEMRTVAVTTGLTYTLAKLSKDSTYYVAVRARKDGVPGRRSVAMIRKPDNGTCQGSISDNDLAMEAVLTPAPTARMQTRSAYSAGQSITIRIKNLDDQPQAKPFQVGYTLGGEMHWETVNTTIAPTASFDYTFQQRVDLSSVKDATLLVRVRLAEDPVRTNDSLVVQLRQIENPKLTLPYTYDVASLPAANFRRFAAGIPGAESFDFVRLEGDARLRTVVAPTADYRIPGMFVLDGMEATSLLSRSYLEANFNLSDYRVEQDDVQLTFRRSFDNIFPLSSDNKVSVRGSSSDAWIDAYHFTSDNYNEVQDGYVLVSVDLAQLLRDARQQLGSEVQVRWTFSSIYPFPSDGYAINDIKLFRENKDIALTKFNAPNYSVCDQLNTSYVSAVIRNNGTNDSFDVPVKMSFDGIITDYNVSYIKKGDSTTLMLYYPGEVSREGRHLLKIWCDKGGDINRSNDTLQAEIFTEPVINTSTYLENFEAGNGGWYTGGTNSSWQFGTPNSAGLPNAASGNNAWKTNLTGAYNNNEESYLYSPCFSMSGMYAPALSFSAYMNMEDCEGDACDMFYIEYNNYGFGWQRLGYKGTGTNWYNSDAGGGAWTGKVNNGWKVFTVPLPSTGNMRLRFVFKSNGKAPGEGIAIDDIHIYNQDYSIYDGPTVSSKIDPITTWNNIWNNYVVDGKIVASVNPRDQDMTALGVKTYLNEAALRVNNKQLVMDRNFVLESGKSFDKPIAVRLYIPEPEIQKLVTTTGYPEISKPKSAYDLTLTKYSGTIQDGEISNNITAGWDFFPHNKVTKVPYGNGYYLEFETKTFSEFWLAKDYMGNGTPLPVTLISFTAEKSISTDNAAVNLKWSTSSETDFSHFIVQVAAGSENAKSGRFDDLALIDGAGAGGTQPYSYTDNLVSSSRTRYYRLKMVDKDGSFTYSAIRSVRFEGSTVWSVYPNPSPGVFRLEPKGKINGPVSIEVLDLAGRVRRQMNLQQNTTAAAINLTASDLPNGLYVIRIRSDNGESNLRVVKE